MQGEWEASGGQGEAPPAWWTDDGALRLDWDRSGWASPEVQRIEAGRIARHAQRRAEANPQQPRIRQIPREAPPPENMRFDAEQAVRVRQLFEERAPDNIIEVNAAEMDRVWSRFPDEGNAPAAFINEAQFLFINIDALVTP